MKGNARRVRLRRQESFDHHMKSHGCDGEQHHGNSMPVYGALVNLRPGFITKTELRGDHQLVVFALGADWRQGFTAQQPRAQANGHEVEQGR
jgi:hypothetical protein